MKGKNYKLEIFCGTGGVGKTTLATSRAKHLSAQGLKVLLITIDPSLRLKQVLNLADNSAGQVRKVNLATVEFDALLMSSQKTFDRLGIDKEKNNKILEILMRPNGGMNEIMAIIEVQSQLESNEYDSIILDTPPGKHFLDFLNASKKIDRFFDKSYIEIFKFLGKNSAPKSGGKKLFGKIVSSGIKKLLTYLEKVTGKDFVETFIDAIYVLHQNKHYFLKALTFQRFLKESNNYQWFLVSSTEQSKVKEIIEITKNATHLSKEHSVLLVNKCLDMGTLEEDDFEATPVKYFIEREKRIINFFDQSKLFRKFLKFPDIYEADPKKHVESLTNHWD